mgnify:CR=1 FL=1
MKVGYASVVGLKRSRNQTIVRAVEVAWTENIGRQFYARQRWIWRVKMLELNIEKEDARNLAEFIEIYFFQNIRDNEDMDNIEYIRSLLKCLDELEKMSK